MLSGSFADLFGDEVRRVGYAAVASGVFYYLASQALEGRFLQRDEVEHTIGAHLPQVFDRSIVTARGEQRLTKTLLMKSIRIDSVKQQMRDAVGREVKVSCLNELLPLSIAGIISAAHVHSLTLTLFVVKHMTLALVHLLRNLKAARGSRGGVVVEKLRAWWSGGVQGIVVESLLARMQEQMGDSPPFSMYDDEAFAFPGGGLCFSVEALLRVAVPRVVEAAQQSVGAALDRRPSHAFAATGVTTGRELRGLLGDACAGLESRVAWSDWLRVPAAAEAAAQGKGHAFGASSGVSSSSGSDEEIEFTGGSTAMLPAPGAWGGRRRDCEIFDSVFGPPRGQTEGEREAQVEERRCEELAREQAARFFHEIIHSASFSELCTAYAAEVLEATVREATDLRTLGSYDLGTDSAKIPHVITVLEKCRMSLFDRDFDVPPYVQIFCEETIRATCRHL